MAKLTLGTDINGKVDYSLPIPVACGDEALAANVVSTVIAPVNFNRVFFSYGIGTNVWVTFDGTTPIVPSGSHNTTQLLRPSQIQLSINGGTVIKFISDTASVVNIRWDLGA